MIFDSHAHYDDEAFDSDRDVLIEKLKENNVEYILNCGSSLKGAVDSVNLAEKYDFIYAAVGIHPEFAYDVNETTIKSLEDLTKNKKVKAVGEIGLDYYYDENPPREVQKKAFILQMELAKKVGLPVVIHDRDAHKDTLDIIKKYPEVKGVIHCFSGSVEFARECLKLGYYIGFTGIVTFKNAKKVINVAKEVPINRMLVETDCPYMAPTPFRGKRNDSSYIKYTLTKLAQIRGEDYDYMENITNRNAKRLLNI